MESTVDKGLVKSIGISNFSSKKTDEWFSDARIQPAINQVHRHPVPFFPCYPSARCCMQTSPQCDARWRAMLCVSALQHACALARSDSPHFPPTICS